MNLTALASIFVNIIAPIVFVAAMGFTLGRLFQIDTRPLSRVTLYLFSPALIFTSAYRSQLTGEFLSIAIFVVLITLLIGAFTLLLVKLMRYDMSTASAFALSALFVNSGNYGLPLALFAFGDAGLARAVVFFTVSAITIQTLAVFIAARGHAGARQALGNVFKLPLLYGFVIGLFLNQASIAAPEPLLKALDLLANAAVPAMLVIMGLELARVSLANDTLGIGLATITKLAVAPVLAFALATAMGLQGLTRAVCIIQSSMPTAVMVSIIAVEFRTRPEFVTSVVFVSTVGSILTLTVLLGILM